jgi:hypothetical protein
MKYIYHRLTELLFIIIELRLFYKLIDLLLL